MARTRGYHYARRADGTKYRVYSRSSRMGRARRATGRRSKGYYRKSRYSGTGGTYRGFGAYHRIGGGTMKAYARNRRGATGGNLGDTVPRIANSKGGSVRIQHTEYLYDVLSSASFQNNSFTLNPGLTLQEGGFSVWLNTVAANFEEWKARGICFHFKSTSAEYSSATGAALGTVSMATNYNALNGAFTSKSVMENYDGAAATKPSKNMNHFVECEKNQTPLHPMYVRTGAVPQNADQRMYDLGVFQIATSGMNSQNVTVGELWVTYEIDFYKPRINPAPNGIFDHFQIAPAAGVLPATPFGTSVAALLYGTTSSTAGGAVAGGIVPAANCIPTTGAARDNFEGGVVQADGSLGPTTANTYYFPLQAEIGTYWMFSYSARGFTAGVPAASTFTPSNCEVANLWVGDTVPLSEQAGAGTATTLLVNYTVRITGQNAKIVFTNAGAQANNAGAQNADLWVIQIGVPVN